MEAKICVYGKSQSRTALGIINAYLKLYPDSSLSELQQAFPKSLNPKSFTDNIIVPEKEALGQEKNFFEREDELIILKNGERLALVELWTKDDFDAICEHAKQYGIEVAEIEGTKPFEKGSYELKFLDGFIPPEENVKEQKDKWWWILLLVLLLLFVLLWLLKCENCKKQSNSNPAPVEDVIPSPAATTSENLEEESAAVINNAVSDSGDAITIKFPDGKEWKIGKNSSEFALFNFLNSDDANAGTKEWVNLDKLRFETGKAQLTSEADKQLESVVMLLKFFPNSHIKIGGYTDNTGTDEMNKRLSTERAKVTAEKLIASGIEKNRIEYEGFGSKFPVCPKNDTDECKAANRRISIIVTQK
jgi:outer membrane protein OmpA-like peptidoglycan-associated protein